MSCRDSASSLVCSHFVAPIDSKFWFKGKKQNNFSELHRCVFNSLRYRCEHNTVSTLHQNKQEYNQFRTFLFKNAPYMWRLQQFPVQRSDGVKLISPVA